MTKEIWINIPVKDIKKSVAFFTHLGFSLNPQHGESSESASVIIGDRNVVLMLFEERTFARFSGNPIADVTKGTEVLFSIDAESRTEVDEMAKKVVEAGGYVYGQPTENYGWMYGCGFVDIDGHRWNLLHMDLDKMRQAESNFMN